MNYNIEQIMEIYHNTLYLLNQVLVGENEAKKAIASGLLCSPNSRILLTGYTGVGKTTLAKFLYNSFNSERISITSDMLPEELLATLKETPNLNYFILMNLIVLVVKFNLVLTNYLLKTK